MFLDMEIFIHLGDLFIPDSQILQMKLVSLKYKTSAASK